MTLHDLSSQLFELSVSGYFNGEKFTRRELEHYLQSLFRPGTSLKLGNRAVMEIALPDGRWHFSVIRWADSPDGFDYCIPDTREQEAQLLAELLA